MGELYGFKWLAPDVTRDPVAWQWAVPPRVSSGSRRMSRVTMEALQRQLSCGFKWLAPDVTRDVRAVLTRAPYLICFKWLAPDVTRDNCWGLVIRQDEFQVARAGCHA